MSDVFRPAGQRNIDRPDPLLCPHTVWAKVAEDENGCTGVCSTCLTEKDFSPGQLADFSASDDWYIRKGYG